MGLVRPLDSGDFTSIFQEKDEADSKSAVLFVTLKTRWPFLATLWPRGKVWV